MRKNHFSWLLACIVAVLLGVTAQAAEAGKTAGRILAAKVHGTVTALNKSDNSRRELHDSDAITQGYVVSTAAKSSVVLIFDNGAAVNLGADASLSIDEFLMDPFDPKYSLADAKDEPSTSTTTLSLERGEFVGNVKHLHRDQGSSFTVNTPVGAAGIRGTTFQVMVGLDAAGKPYVSVATAEGLVSFTPTGGVAYLIPAGKRISISFDGTINPSTGELTIVPGSVHVGGLEDLSAADQAVIAQAMEEILTSIATSANNPAGAPGVTPPPVQTTPGDGKKLTVAEKFKAIPGAVFRAGVWLFAAALTANLLSFAGAAP